MAQITFNVGEGGLGRPLPTKDNYSGLLFQSAAALPTGYGTDRTKLVKSLEEFEALGVVATTTNYEVLHYHVSEFFRIQPKGWLWVGIYDITTDSFDGTELTTMQNIANGEIRQFGVFLVDTYASGYITDTQTVCETNEAAKKPFSVLLGCDLTATNVAALTAVDLRALDSENVTLVLGEDGNATGAALATSKGYSITSVGASLGAVSLAQVHENIGWVGKFNMSNGTELETVNFATGEAFADQTQATLDALNTAGYLFLQKIVGKTGTFHRNDPTSTLATSDFAYISNQRTIDKAIRQVNFYMSDQINAPLYVDATTGQLTEATVALFDNEARKGLSKMVQDGELSGFAVIIDPTQDILSSSQLEITLRLVPVGSARTIVINIGYSVNLN